MDNIRLTGVDHTGVDHTGFNLPWFNGTHPTILKLREDLADSCLYHNFPEHIEKADWDFIIPGTSDEISKIVETDYELVRKPKIEIVSFDSCSTPLVQFEIEVNERYSRFSKLFPEGIKIPEINSVWVYIRYLSNLDFCFVLNETSNGDWSREFKNERL